MIEQLIDLPIGSMVSIDNKKVINFFNDKDFSIVATWQFEYENDDRIIIIELDKCHLIITNVYDEPRYYVGESDSDDVRLGPNKFLKTITITNDKKKTVYKLNRTIYSDNEFELPSFAEYSPVSNAFFDFIMVQVTPQSSDRYLAFEIKEFDIVI